MKPIEELAEEVGFYVAYENKEVTNKELEALRQAIIKDFVESLGEPYAYGYEHKSNNRMFVNKDLLKTKTIGNWNIKPIYSLEEWK